MVLKMTTAPPCVAASGIPGFSERPCADILSKAKRRKRRMCCNAVRKATDATRNLLQQIPFVRDGSGPNAFNIEGSTVTNLERLEEKVDILSGVVLSLSQLLRDGLEGRAMRVDTVLSTLCERPSKSLVALST